MGWNNPPWKVEPMTDDILNTRIRDNMNALKTPPSDDYFLSTGIVSDATSFTDITGLSLSITTTGGDILVIFSCVMALTAGLGYLDITLDGSRLGGNDGILSFAGYCNVNMNWLIQDVPAGEHTITIQGKRTTTSFTTSNNQMIVREVS